MFAGLQAHELFVDVDKMQTAEPGLLFSPSIFSDSRVGLIRSRARRFVARALRIFNDRRETITDEPLRPIRSNRKSMIKGVVSATCSKFSHRLLKRLSMSLRIRFGVE